MIFYRELENQNLNKYKKEVVKHRLIDLEWLDFSAKRWNNSKLPSYHANVFNVPSEY